MEFVPSQPRTGPAKLFGALQSSTSPGSFFLLVLSKESYNIFPHALLRTSKSFDVVDIARWRCLMLRGGTMASRASSWLPRAPIKGPCTLNPKT